jgi:hypothetical protein
MAGGVFRRRGGALKLFRRQSSAEKPQPGNDLASLMARFGRFEYDPQGSSEDPSWIYGSVIAPLYASGTEDPVKLLARLEREVSSKGGWGAYGAGHAVWEILSTEQRASLRDNASYNAVVDASLQFLRENGVPPMKVTGYEWDHWTMHGGTIDTWIPPRDPPRREEARITPLRAGELRPVARLTATSDSNVMLVRGSAQQGYTGVVDARYSDEDPRRVQSDWESADDLYDLYLMIGRSLQTPPTWHDPEIEPFFPLPKPRI